MLPLTCPSEMCFNLGFIGGGNMSTAIFKGIMRNEALPPSKIWVSGPRIENLTGWSDIGANVTNKNGEVVDKCDVIFLGVKPQMLDAAMQDCVNSMHGPITKNVLFVSMLAGVGIEKLNKALSNLNRIQDVSVSVIRIMPNTPMTVGAGACLYAPSSTVTDHQCAILEKLMKCCGIVEKVSENQIESLGSLVGCGPAYLYIVIEALADGAVKQGAPREQAQRLAAQVVMGSGLMVLQSGKHPAELKDQVCSPGGTTIAGIAELEEGRIRSSFIKALEASTNRNKQLG